jgi:hypothetical protein
MMVRLVLDGATPREVSNEFDISESRISILRRSPLWLEEEKEMRKDFLDTYKSQLMKIVPEAVEAFKDGVSKTYLVEDGTEFGRVVTNDVKTRVMTAKEVFNRVGITEKIEIEGEIKVTADDLLERLDNIAEEKIRLRRELGVIDIEALSSDESEIGPPR